MDKTNIYVFRLKSDKYYIGKSNDPIRRYQEHINGEDSSWTKI